MTVDALAKIASHKNIDEKNFCLLKRTLKTVTWLKRDEDQLLTAGGQVYSHDSRYSVSHVRHQQLWELSVRDVMLKDAGTYECQLTTHPPTSLFFILKVVEARAILQGAPEVHVQTGVSLRLHCSVLQATQPPAFIFWFHNGSMINYAPRRPLRVLKHHYSSTLLMADVTWDDAGAYRCEPHKASPANLTLHVVAGEKHAALHNGQGDGSEEHNSAPGLLHRSNTPLLIGSSCLLVILLSVYIDNFYDMVAVDSDTSMLTDNKTNAGGSDTEPSTLNISSRASGLQRYGASITRRHVPSKQRTDGCREATVIATTKMPTTERRRVEGTWGWTDTIAHYGVTSPRL
ncbi:uncharacterized protein LOC121870785 [Homarus americanus]|uniref:uncharacterized protein LOC121870785 n=1 Tax=Homarus americanus TaxID=6706 RepID=UPI001C43F4A0|nr:uncharacterized protein LOC121870785 [Homarus americanus]